MLDLIINFFLEHWKVIILVLLLLVDVIVSIVNGSKSKAIVLLALVKKLPYFINEAEKLYKEGSLKYTKVFSLAVDFLCSLTGLSESKVCAKYHTFIDSQIEDMLSTPEKKG